MAKGRGYSTLTARYINEANSVMLGVKLGKICVAKNIPVSDVAEYLKVSRMTVYSWFLGRHDVADRHYAKVEELVEKLS